MDHAGCSFCHQREGVVPFHIALSNQAAGVGVRRSATLALGGIACAACKDRLDGFKRLRIIALASLAGSIALLLAAVSGAFGGPGGAVVVVLALAADVAAFVAVAGWHRRTARALLTDAQQAEVLRRLPDLGGVLAWQQVRVFPGSVDGALPLSELGGMRGARRKP